MFDEKLLEKIFETIISGVELTTKKLNELGFNSKSINELIEKGYLKRIKRGYYTILSVDKLFLYGKKLLMDKKYEEARICFEICYKIDSKCWDACLHLFLNSLQNKDYEKAFEYFESLFTNNDINSTRDCNFYLFLLNIITDIPDKHRQYAKVLKFDDIKLDIKSDKSMHIKNKIRLSALNQKFGLANKQFSEFISATGKMEVQDAIVGKLLKQAYEIQQIDNRKIHDFIAEEKYEELIEYINEKGQKHHLKLSINYLLNLTKVLLKIKNEKVLPQPQTIDPKNIFEAIDGQNYRMALSFCIEDDKSTMYILLTLINKEMDKIRGISNSDEQVIVPENDDESEKQEVINDVPIVDENKSVENLSKPISFMDIIVCLMNQELNTAFQLLSEYLEEINKKQYEFLIVDLIKLSLVENDISFSKPMSILAFMSKENFEFNIFDYIQKFYEYIEKNKLEEARIILDIISRAEQLGKNNILINELENLLNGLEKTKKVEAPKEEKVEYLNVYPEESEVALPSSEEITNVETKQNIVQEEIPIVNEPQRPVNTIKREIFTYDDKEFINRKMEEARERGIVILKPMNNIRRKGIHNIVKSVPDIVSFSIGCDNNRRIVLRFKPYKKHYVKISELIENGDKFYKNGQYDDAIKCYKEVLEFGVPKVNVYAKLGLVYLKKRQINIAIDYMFVATELSKTGKEGFKYDFTELIAKLKDDIPEEDRKPNIKMQLSDFDNDIENNYGINSIDIIFELVSFGVSVEEACKSVNLTEDQKNIVLLIFAREYYSQEYYSVGDEYLKKVEVSQSKSTFVKSLFAEIRKNKKFYKNRAKERHDLPTLSLKI